MIRLIACVCCFVLMWGCSAKSPAHKGGSAGSRPYTVRGKTYYPLKSAHGFVEEGVASWYGPGFHGKTTANGETYNQYAMTAAHKLLPLGTEIRVTHLENGKSVLVRVNDRGPFVDDRIIDLSRAAASRLEMMNTGTARVRIQSLGGLPQITAAGDIKGKIYIQVGAFGQEANARKIVNALKIMGQKGRLFFGNNQMWNVQAGPWRDSDSAQKALPILRAVYPKAFIVAGG